MTRRVSGFSAFLAAVIGWNGSALAACPLEFATYGQPESATGIDFSRTKDSVTVTNTFSMTLDDKVVLDGIVQWSDGVTRPNGALMYKCPEGDVTGDELAACTPWQGVIYTSDDKGNIGLLPAEGADAPQTLILPDLGPSLQGSAALDATKSRAPWDVFTLKGCRK